MGELRDEMGQKREAAREVVRVEEREQIMGMLRRGKTRQQIAGIMTRQGLLGEGTDQVKYERVCRRVREVHTAERERRETEERDIRLELVSNQLEVIQQAYEEWERSKTELTKKVAKRREAGESTTTETTLETQMRTAQGKFLEIVQKGWMEIGKLEGAYPEERKHFQGEFVMGAFDWNKLRQPILVEDEVEKRLAEEEAKSREADGETDEHKGASDGAIHAE